MIRCHTDHHVHFYSTDLFTIYYVKPVVLTDYSLDLVAALVCGVSFVPSTLSDNTYPSILCYLVSGSCHIFNGRLASKEGQLVIGREPRLG